MTVIPLASPGSPSPPTHLTPLTKEQAAYAARGLVVVNGLAPVFAREWPGVHISDFVSVGHEAVVTAARSFDPTRGVPFEKYASRTIYGQMLDLAHRETFTVQRAMRNISRALGQVEDRKLDERDLLQDFQSTTSDRDEVVDRLRGRAAELTAAGAAGGTTVLTAEELAIQNEEERDALTKLRRGLEGLKPKERLFVHLYYEEELTLEEAAVRLEVSKRTVQRAHDEIKAKLAKALRGVST